MRTPSLLLVLALAAAGCLPEDARYIATAQPPPDGPDADVPDADPNAPDARPDTPSILLEPDTLPIIEGQTQAFKVKLSAQPMSAVTVALEPSTGITLQSPTITFDPATENATVGKNVDVTVIDDDNTDDERLTINLSATGYNPATLSVVVDDQDELKISASQTTLTMTEGQQSFIRVALTAQPPDTVTVTPVVDVANAAYITVGSAMIFTRKNWSQPQDLPIVALEDDDAFVRPNVPFTLRSQGLMDVIVRVTINDNDVQGIQVEGAPLTIAERTRRSFTVRPRQRPAGDVTFNLTEPAGVDLDRTSVSFTPTNYQTAQSIEVLAVGDENLEDSSVTIGVTATPSDGFARADVIVNITDPDVQSILETAPAQINLTEGGSAVTFTVRPRFQPANNVVLNVGVTNAGIEVRTNNRLTFTPSNYTTPQDVTVAARADNNLVGFNGEVVITMPDAEARIPVVATDNDRQVLHTTLDATNAITLQEGTNSGTRFRVWLGFVPDTTATQVTVASDDPALVTVRDADRTLTFNATNFDQPQTVLLTAASDLDEDDASTMVRVNSTAVASGKVINVTVDDTTMRTNIGWPTDFEGDGSFLSIRAFAWSYNVQVPVTIDQFSVLARAAGNNARMGIYLDDGANQPGTLRVQTGAFTLSATPTVSSTTISPVMLQPGKYWIAIMFDQSTLIGQASGPPARRCIGRASNFSAMPAAPQWSCFDATNANIFATGVQQ